MDSRIFYKNTTMTDAIIHYKGYIHSVIMSDTASYINDENCIQDNLQSNQYFFEKHDQVESTYISSRHVQ